MKQILYRIKSLFLLVAIAGGISACADDKGNYNYHDIPEVKIEGIGNSITALAYQNLSIPVQLDGLQADENRYEYEWRAIRQFEAEDENDAVSEVLATTKEFNDIISLRPGPYKLIYTVKDKQLDVFYQQQANLSVVTTTSEGWVLLCSENGNVRLDMISTVLGEEVHSKDMLADSDMPFKKGPLALIALNTEEQQVDPISPFYLLTEEGTTRLHKDAFEWKEEYLMKYEMGDMSDAKPTHITSAIYFRMMVTPDGIYSSNFGYGTEALWESKLNYLRNDDNTKEYIQVAPYVGCNITNSMQFAPVFMFYDLDHKRFVYHPGGMYGDFTQDRTAGCVNMSDDEAGEDVSFSFPIGYNYVYMENTGRKYTESSMAPGSYNNITFTILENNGVYHLYGITLGDYLAEMLTGVPTPPYTKTHYANLSNCTDITRAEHFAFSPLNNQMFYAVDGKVYRVNLDTSTPSAQFQFEVPGEITCLKFYLYRNAENARRSYDLIVGSDKGGTDGGELRVYEAIDNLAQITDYKEYHSGFGRIVDIIYKEPITQE
ncbi:PKD-like family lipoprotein [Butyricimonas sp. Marseille-P3923]|uniref:PKD-like family lipoprotein n=1 Tax=Butyricimonas sp. Marseille-P3923 TaxID=1987504 RepID=UPI000C08B57E|nr:PKD-like family lipoprotein [Butyricimonas sp. Marseille-P3923]